MTNDTQKAPLAVADAQMAAVQDPAFRSPGPPRGRPRGFKAILNAVPAAVFIAHDPQCRRITRSRAACEMLRAPPATDSPPDASPVERPTQLKIHRADQDQELASWEVPVQQAARGIEVRGLELEVRSDDRVVRHIYGSASPLLDDDGQAHGAVAVFVDVTDLKQRHESLTAQVRELARSNSELEQFATLVSHDLRSPLISLSGCAQLLFENHANSLAPEGRELVGYIQDSARHMSHLIKSLLDYAGAAHGRLEIKECDANLAVASALESLQTPLDTAAGRVTFDTLPVVRADANQLCQLMQNLIENAIKFCGKAPPRIHVSGREEPGSWTFSVKDHGVGINSKDFDWVFRPFERLPSSGSQYAGLGIGLATCRKIVERLGGRIWVESQAGEGATFFFSLPRSAGGPGESVKPGSPLSGRNSREVRP